MKIIVTGHNGFLGNALVKKLQLNHEVIGISREKNNLDLNVSEYHPSNISEINIYPDIIIMCHAAVSSGKTQIESRVLFDSNVSFTSDLIKTFPDAFFVYTSSISVFGEQIGVINENTVTSPSTEYALSKLWGEKIVLTAKKYAILRFSSLYGDKMKENTLIPNYINHALNNKIIEVWGKGDRRQNYLHISDALEMILAIIRTLKEGIYLGVDKVEYSNLELAQIIAESTLSKIQFKNIDDTKSNCFDNSLTRKDLNWEPKMNIENGIDNYIKWKIKQS